MIKLGKDKKGKQLYMTFEEVEQARGNLDLYKGKLNNQQYAKLRKTVNKSN